MSRIRRRVRDRPGAQARLVGKDAAGDAAPHTHEHGTDHTARKGPGIKGSRKDRSENTGNPADMHEDYTQSQENIKNRHKGHQLFREAADPPDPSQKDPAHTQGQHNAQHQVDHSQAPGLQDVIVDKDRVDGRHDRIDLGGIARPEDSDGPEDRKEDRKKMPFLRQAVFNKVHGSADPVPLGVALAEMDRQDHLGVFRAHAQQGGDPHPEDRAGPPDRDRARHAGDIARADRSSQRRTDRLEGRHGALLRLFFIKDLSQRLPDRIDKAPDLDKTRTDTQVEADADDADHGGDSPDKAVDFAVNAADKFKHIFKSPFTDLTH